MRLSHVAAVFLIVLIRLTLCLQTVSNQTDKNDLERSAAAAVRPPHSNQTSAVENEEDQGNYWAIFQSGTIHKKDNCTPPTIDDFPPDPFTFRQRKEGKSMKKFHNKNQI